jgi:hypothetical protein
VTQKETAVDQHCHGRYDHLSHRQPEPGDQGHDGGWAWPGYAGQEQRQHPFPHS